MPESLAALLAHAGTQAGAARPVEDWNPPDCGAIDIHIDAEGRWFHLGTPIGRERLVRLFGSILRREADDRHVLVTPVEKLTITVEDVAFLAVEMHCEGIGWDQVLTFRTNVGDVVVAGREHPLRFAVGPQDGGLKPYLAVRGRLEARLTRPLLHELVGHGVVHEGRFGVVSGGVFFEMPQAVGAE